MLVPAIALIWIGLMALVVLFVAGATRTGALSIEHGAGDPEWMHALMTERDEPALPVAQDEHVDEPARVPVLADLFPLAR